MRIIPINAYQFSDLVEYLPYDTAVSLQTILTDYGITYTISTGSKIEELFKKLYNHFSNYEIFELCADESSQSVIEGKFREWIVKFINEYENSKSYFETLINAYDTAIPTLMADIEASTDNEVVFNDTPQVEGGIFKTDTYATTYTKTSSKSKTPMKTPIERLKDIQDNLRNLWKDWIKDMSKLFVEKQEGVIYED